MLLNFILKIKPVETPWTTLALIDLLQVIVFLLPDSAGTKLPRMLLMATKI